MGFKDFSAGEVLTAADVDNFLMRQTVMVFDDSAARGSALGTLTTEGMVTFLKDTDSLEFFDGASFEPVSDPVLTQGTAGNVLISNGTAGAFWANNGTTGQNIVSAGTAGVTFENSISPLMLLGV